MKRRLAAALVALYLAWCGLRAGTSVLGELASADPAELRAALALGERERLARELGRWEAVLPVGREDAVLAALERDVAPGETVFFYGRRELAPAMAFGHLHVAAYPRLVLELQEIPAGWNPLRVEPDRRIHFLEFERQAPGLAELGFERTAGGDGWALWKLDPRGS
jgi:hypothetical protein